MNLLTDTHALVWFTDGDPQLPAAARTALGDPANAVFVSPAAYWEIAIKVHLGKWRLNLPYHVYTDTVFNVYGFREIPIRPDQTARLIGLPNHHNDPFDRLMAVQCLSDQLTIVSGDTKFDLYGVPRIWA